MEIMNANSSSTIRKFTMCWHIKGIMSVQCLISLSQNCSVGETITILL